MASMVVPHASALRLFLVRSPDMRLLITWAFCMMPARGLLISWAMPAASPPTDSIFSDWIIICSIRTRSVTSSTRITAPSMSLEKRG